MDNETLSYDTRKSERSYCAHCMKEMEHRCCFDPNLKAWVEICTGCEMVELADDELEKKGKSYKLMYKKRIR